MCAGRVKAGAGEVFCRSASAACRLRSIVARCAGVSGLDPLMPLAADGDGEVGGGTAAPLVGPMLRRPPPKRLVEGVSSADFVGVGFYAARTTPERVSQTRAHAHIGARAAKRST